MGTRARLVTRRQVLGALPAIAASPRLAAGAGRESRGQGDQRMASDEGPDAPGAEITKALERYVAAWRAGYVAALVACYHDDFTLHYGGRSSLAGDHRGRPAARRALAGSSGRTSLRLVAFVDVMAGRRRGAVIAREAFQRDGLTAELDRIFVYTVQDGKLRECWVYDSDQELIDRFLADGAPAR